MTMTTSPRVYVACLACYNDSKLVGEWFDADSSLLDTFGEWQKEHQDKTGHEEYVVHDSEGFHKALGEVSVTEELQEMGEFIEEHDIPAILALENFSGDLDAAKSAVENSYRGAFDSLADYAQDFAEQCYDLKNMGNLANYIDWDRFARDIEMEGSIWSDRGSDGMIHVFDND